MKKRTTLITVIICCIGFAGMNIFKADIKNLHFLLTMSSETLANAEAIGNDEGEEGSECPKGQTINYIHATDEYRETVLCKKMNTLEFAGYVLNGYYSKGSYYSVHYKLHKCKESTGTCCDLTSAGLEMIWD